MSEYDFINIGALPNDGTGDPLRVAFDKVNENFDKLFSTATSTSSIYTTGNQVNQVIFETDASKFTYGTFIIRSKNPVTTDSQSIRLDAQIDTTKQQVKFTGYGILIFGNSLAAFDMDVSNGNVRILCNPLVDQSIFHFISAKILFQGEQIPGLPIALDGFQDSTLVTEANITISTEA